jgi:hypothetical protein
MKLLAYFTALAVPLFGADDYQLKMHRNAKVGDKFLEEGKLSYESNTVIKINRKPVKTDVMKFSFSYAGETEALAVNKFGKVTKERVKLQKFEGEFNGMPITQLSAGDELVVEAEEQRVRKSVQVNGRPATDEQTKLAQAFISVSGKEEPASDDEIFGTTKRIKPGDEWAVNAAKAAEDAERMGFPKTKPEDVQGKTKFLEVVQSGGLPCLRLRGEMNLRGSGMNIPEAPPGLTVQKMTIQAILETDSPVDPDVNYDPSGKMMMVASLTGGGTLKQGGNEVEMELSSDMKQARQQTTKPLK